MSNSATPSQTPAGDATRQTIDGYLDALLNGGDFPAFFADDVLWTTMETGEEIRGRDAVAEFITSLHTQIFDAHPELRGVLAENGKAYLEADFVGTHIADFAGIPATGAKVRVPYCVAYDIDGARITALRAYLPLGVLIAQLQTPTQD
jgi:steroid delta-isomerase-like uncharacterized protein